MWGCVALTIYLSVPVRKQTQVIDGVPGMELGWWLLMGSVCTRAVELENREVRKSLKIGKIGKDRIKPEKLNSDSTALVKMPTQNLSMLLLLPRLMMSLLQI